MQQDLSLASLLKTNLDPIFWTPERLNKPSAWWGHVPFAFWLTVASEPAVLVELGTHYGVSYAAFCEAIRRSRLGTRSYAVDTWVGDAQAGLYGGEIFEELSGFHDSRYGTFSELLRTTFDEACQAFEDGTVNILHIDGYHTYDAVRHYFETWRPKLSKRAIVLFHDTNVRRGDFGVWRFFSELKMSMPCFEFLHGYGLGVAAVGSEVPAAVMEICGLTEAAEIAALRERFCHLGARWVAVAAANLENLSLAASVRQLEEAAAEKDAHSEQLAASVRQLEEAAAEKDAHSEQLAASVRQLEEAAAEKDAHSEQLAASVRQLEEAVAEKDAHSEQLAASVRQLEEAVAEKDAHSEQLAASVRQLEEAVAEKDAHSEQLAASVRQLEEAAAEKDAHSEQLAASVRQLEEAAAEKDARLTQAESTASYISGRYAEKSLSLPGVPVLLEACNAFRSTISPYHAHNKRQIPSAYRSRKQRKKNLVSSRVYKAVRDLVFFDAEFYLQSNPDVGISGLDPVVHYIRFGAREGRNPGPYFSETNYRNQYPDVAATGVSALEHYELFGRAEGRRIVGCGPNLRQNVIASAPRRAAHADETSAAPGDVKFVSTASPLPPVASHERYCILAERQFGDIPAILHQNKTPIPRSNAAGIRDAEYFEHIKSADIVSFDIFDTALLRTVAHPTSVFDIIGAISAIHSRARSHNFAELRVWAERIARNRAVDRGASVEIGLDDIYNVIAEALQLNEVEKNELRNAELDEERKVLKANPAVLNWARRAAELGKRVIFVSDMYLPSSFLVETLSAAGYTSPEVYVSCEHSMGKSDGKLFHLVARKCGVEGAKIFHVGDNLQADKVCADAAGWRAAHYAEEPNRQPYALQLPDTSRLCVENIATSAGIGLSRLHRLNVVASELSFEERLARHIGYEILGPTVLGFAGWIAACAKRDKLERVLFLSRDGWLPSKVYDLLRNNGHAICDARYIAASRRLLYCTMLRSEADIDAVLPKIHFSQTTTLEEYLDIFHLVKADILPHSEQLGFGDLDEAILPAHEFHARYSEAQTRLTKLLKLLAPKVLQRAAEQQVLLRDYYMSAANIRAQRRFAIVDLGWAGSLIRPLETIFAQISDKVRPCAYFFGLNTYSQVVIPTSVPASAYFFDRQDKNPSANPMVPPSFERPHEILYKSLSLFEILFCENKTTVIDLRREEAGENIVAFRAPDSFTSEQRRFLETAHEACLEFAQDAIKMLPRDLDQWDFKPLIAHTWMRLFSYTDKNEARFLGSFPHRVDPSGRAANTCILSTPKHTSDATKLCAEWRDSMWPTGWFAVAEPSMRDKIMQFLGH